MPLALRPIVGDKADREPVKVYLTGGVAKRRVSPALLEHGVRPTSRLDPGKGWAAFLIAKGSTREPRNGVLGRRDRLLKGNGLWRKRLRRRNR